MPKASKPKTSKSKGKALKRLTPKQKKRIDKNNNNRIDEGDFAILRNQRKNKKKKGKK